MGRLSTRSSPKHDAKTQPVEPLSPTSTPINAQTAIIPNSVLESYAAASNTSLAALGRLTISDSAGDLWQATTSYLSFSPVPSGHPPVPLQVHNVRRVLDDGFYDDESDYSDSEDDENTADRTTLPVFSLAPCTVDVMWPPPKHLAADALVACRANNPMGNLNEAVLNGTCLEENGGKHNMAAARNVSNNCIYDMEVENGLHTEKNDNDMDQSTFRLILYSVGNPKETWRGVESKYEMLLLSAHGPGPLMRFAREVIEWSKKVEKGPDLKSCFQLLRFKVDCDGGRWISEGMKRARPIDSVILEKGKMETIVTDIEKFRSVPTRMWYLKHGLPYRRSFLFYGPPGTGKTSTIRVIASKFKLTCCMLSVANQKFSNQTLGDALSNIPRNSLLVLEDVDALFNEDRSNKSETQLTFSGMLNALDGLVSVEGLVTIMTTNHLERLERALIRGGRVDRRLKFDHPTETQLRQLFRSFYQDADSNVVDQFAENVLERREGDEARAISTLQQLFIAMRENNAEECVAGMDKFFKEYLQDSNSSALSYMI